MASNAYKAVWNPEKEGFYLQTADDKAISYWHCIPLKADEGGGGEDGNKSASNIFHMVVEIPRGTRAKMEIQPREQMNPIRQDVRNGRPRYVHHDYPYRWNYGALPQTWEDPEHKWFADEGPDWQELSGKPGDNDPLDVIDIGEQTYRTGDIIKVKILGALAMLDSGEVDWKLVVCDLASPLAQKLNSLDDVNTEKPKLLDETRDWFRSYKVPDGKPPNQFAFGEKYLDAEKALDVIDETHECWKRLTKDHERMDRLGMK